MRVATLVIIAGAAFFGRCCGARDYAERIIRELKGAGGWDAPGLFMIVKDDSGNAVLTMPF